MPSLRHPPPPPIHGLLSIKRGRQFLKPVRRLAHLDNAILELRLHQNDPVETTICLIDAHIQPDHTHRTIILTTCTHRIKLYVHTAHKFIRWLDAFQACTHWKLSSFYHLFTQQLLGVGTFATVHRAVHRKTRDIVAVKTILVADPYSPSAPHPSYVQTLIARECRIARLLDHRAIVNVYDVFQAPGSVCVVMECLPYTLHHLMRAHTVLPERCAAKITHQLLGAVAYLHDKNIVHRDLKPDNILCADISAPLNTSPLTVKICDFGMANFLGKRVERPVRRDVDDGPLCIIPKTSRNLHQLSSDEHSDSVDDGAYGAFSKPVHLSSLMPRARSSGNHVDGYETGCSDDEKEDDEKGDDEKEDDEKENDGRKVWCGIDGLTLTSAIGAPSYVSPELVKGERYGKPVDVWGIGVILFYMLAGYLPFEGKDGLEVIQKISECKPDFETGCWGRVSSDAKRFVQLLLNNDPRKRITAESALSNSWLLRFCGSPQA